MRLARSVVAGLVVGALAGFLIALLRPREVCSTQPLDARRQRGQASRTPRPTGFDGPAGAGRPAGSASRNAEAIR
jgi:hypothetical protein